VTMGTLSLTLRGADPGEHPDIGVLYTSDLGVSNAAADLVNRARQAGRQARPAVAPKTPLVRTPPPPTPSNGVKLYKGAKGTEVRF
jgi:hypothetical protein